MTSRILLATNDQWQWKFWQYAYKQICIRQTLLAIHDTSNIASKFWKNQFLIFWMFDFAGKFWQHAYIPTYRRQTLLAIHDTSNIASNYILALHCLCYQHMKGWPAPVSKCRTHLPRAKATTTTLTMHLQVCICVCMSVRHFCCVLCLWPISKWCWFPTECFSFGFGGWVIFKRQRRRLRD